MNTINIIENQTINPIFVRANSVIIKTVSIKYDNEDLYRQALIVMWAEKFNAELVFENKIPKCIKFSSHADLLNFLMKW